MTTQTPLLPKLKSDFGSGSGFSQIFDSGSERKTQNPAGVDSGTSGSGLTSGRYEPCAISAPLMLKKTLVFLR